MGMASAAGRLENEPATARATVNINLRVSITSILVGM
jgi:hypothetical protein